MNKQLDSNPWFKKWLKIHSGVDLQLKLSVNADLKFSASNEGERVDDKKARGSFTGNSLANQQDTNRRLEYYRREILEHTQRSLNLA